MVDGDGLGDLQESDELEPIEALGASLVGMDLRQSRIHGRVGRGEAVEWANRKNPRNCLASR